MLFNYRKWWNGKLPIKNLTQNCSTKGKPYKPKTSLRKSTVISDCRTRVTSIAEPPPNLKNLIKIDPLTSPLDLAMQITSKSNAKLRNWNSATHIWLVKRIIEHWNRLKRVHKIHNYLPMRIGVPTMSFHLENTNGSRRSMGWRFHAKIPKQNGRKADLSKNRLLISWKKFKIF